MNREFSLKKTAQKLSLMILLLVCGLPSRAGDVVWTRYLKGTGISDNAEFTMSDFLLRGQYNKSEYDYKVSFVYGREDRKDVQGSADWSFEVEYSIFFYNADMLLQSQSTGNKLKIVYDPVNPGAIVLEAHKIFNAPGVDFEKVRLQITDVTPIPTGTVIPDDVRLELSLINKSGFDFNSIPTEFGFEPTAKRLYWSYIKGAEYYQVEWVYIDAEDGYTPPNTEAAFAYKEPVRIVVKDQYFDKFNFTYPQGKVYFRFRGVGKYAGQEAGSEKVADWNHLPTPYTIGTGFEDKKTWQYVTTYAEDGKYKKAITYYDGTLRNRQVQTNLSSENTVLAGETKYDFEGRPVVNILPVPIVETSLRYENNLNSFAKGKAGFDKTMVTNESESLTDTSEAYIYYSSLNPEINTLSNQFIPDAEGYPYSQILYTRDGTGRPRMQSGVGKTFRLGDPTLTNKNTSYKYSTANDTELRRLFGSNVGNAAHYKKNYVTDANGQRTVSYLDQEGRMVASCLTGSTPGNLDRLASNDTVSIKVNLDASNTIDKSNKISKSVSIINNVNENTRYKFNYSLKGVISQSALVPGFCKECVYELVFTIKDPDDLVAYTTTVPDIKPTVAAEDCSTNVYDKGYVIQDVEVLFTKEGEYQVIKELKLASEPLTVSLDSLKKKTGYPKYSTFEQSFLSKVDISRCDVSCEDQCRSEILRRNPIWAADPAYYATAINDSVMIYVGTFCPGYLSNIVVKVTQNECKSIYDQIVEQVRPGGVYNINNHTWVSDAYSYIMATSQFRDANGVLLPIQPTLAQLRSATGFDDNWLDELVSRHREFPHYENCLVLTPSRIYDKNMAIVKDWTEAIAEGYIGTGINPLDTDPMFALGGGSDVAINEAKANILSKINVYTNEQTLQMDVDNSGAITNRNVSLVEFVSSYVPYGKDTSFVPTDEKKWQLYRSLYNGLKLTEEHHLVSTVYSFYSVPSTVIKRCPYFNDNNKIVDEPAFGYFVNIDAVNNRNDLNITQGCITGCIENVKVWMTMLENNCGEILDSDSIAIRNQLLTYCNNHCGYTNPLGLIYTEDLNVDPSLVNAQNILNNYSGCLLQNISVINPDPTTCKNGVLLKIWNLQNPCSGATCISYATTAIPTTTPSYEGIVNNIKYNSATAFFPGTTCAFNIRATFDTYLRIDETDYYSFSISVDNRADIYIDGLLAYSDNTDLCASVQGTKVINSLYLSKGFHHVYIEYGQGLGPYSISMQMKRGAGYYYNVQDIDLYVQIPEDEEDICIFNTFDECPINLNSDNDCTNDPIFLTTCGEKALNSINTLIQKAALGSPHSCTPLVMNQAENVTISGCSNFSTQIMIDIPESCDGKGRRDALVVKDDNGFKIFYGTNAGAYQAACACDPGSNYYASHTLSQDIKFYTLDVNGDPLYISTGDIAYVKEPFVDCEYARSPEALGFKSSFGVAVKLGKINGSLIDEIIAYVEASGFTADTASLTWKMPGLPERTLCNNTYTVNWAAIKTDCIEKLNNTARYEAYVAWKEAEDEFISNYFNEKVDKCFDAPFEEHLTYSYANNEYHYTLYYYDQSGNLIQTVPPAGVDLLGSSAFDPVTGIYIPGNEPAHRMVTKYRFNSLNQQTWLSTPDGGETYFWYNSKGELRLSQNDKQLAASSPAANQYSYTRYDRQGRVEEVGQIQDLNDQTRAYMMNPANEKAILTLLDNIYFPAISDPTTLTQRTVTVYDIGDSQQENLRGRVSCSSTRSTETVTDVTTRFSYDPHGNVKNLRQDIAGFGVKQTDYCYNIISGKVSKVYYQKGQSDQFVHQYEYDSDHRIKSVQTSPDDVVWEEDAHYFYYKHGPLARTELGQDKVQGLDYYYTTEGHLKGVNIPALRTADPTGNPRVTADIGLDGVTSINNFNKYVGQDEFSYSLGYFNGDYKPIQTGLNLYAAGDDHWTTMGTNVKASGLYNGNIATMVTQIHSMGSHVNSGGSFLAQEQSGLHAYAYHYDQLNRITAAAHYKTYGTGWENRSTPQSSPQSYDARYAYEPNGNITNALINGQSTGLMDELTYNYNKSGGNLVNNRLNYAADAAGQTEGNDLPGTQALNNYQYDAIGNLISDASEGITNINWSAYGKVLSVLNSSNSKADLSFTYDALGNRIKKVVSIPSVGTKTTYYVRDASGNIMATYEIDGATTTTEYNILGSSRLGSWEASLVVDGIQRRIPKKKQYELSNHLGNVLATISSGKIGVDINSDATTDYYSTQIITGQDYYPYGMTMPGRIFGFDYRFGFNGKEKDVEWNSGGATYDYGFRIYDVRLGKFLSMDPLMKEYPELTTYQFASNSPIMGIDRDGLEFEWFGTVVEKVNSGYNTVVKKTNDTYNEVAVVATNTYLKVEKTVVKKAGEIKESYKTAVKSAKIEAKVSIGARLAMEVNENAGIDLNAGSVQVVKGSYEQQRSDYGPTQGTFDYIGKDKVENITFGASGGLGVIGGGVGREMEVDNNTHKNTITNSATLGASYAGTGVNSSVKFDDNGTIKAVDTTAGFSFSLGFIIVVDFSIGGGVTSEQIK